MEAQVTVKIPTLTCNDANPNSLKVLYMMQYLELSSGSYAEGYLQAQCSSGSASYSIAGGVCDNAGCIGCSPGGCDDGCSSSSSLTVGARGSIGIRENTSSTGDDQPLEVTVAGGGGGSGAHLECLVFGSFPEEENVYTGMCGIDVGGAGKRTEPSTIPPPPMDNCRTTGRRPTFSTENFTGATINDDLLSSYEPAKYNMVSGSTVQIMTSKIGSDG
jgi:hypothetical protein